MAQASEKDLKAQLDELRERYRQLKDDELFVAWFMQSYVTDTEPDAIDSLVGGPKDKNLDAIYVDDSSKRVFIVQGKYRQKVGGGNEKRNDVLAFADLARIFTEEETFKSYKKDLSVAVLGRADEAFKRIRTRNYGLQLCYVTLGNVSGALVSEANSTVRKASRLADIDILDGKRVLRLLSDYLDGVAPPVPLLEMELESGHGVQVKGVLQRFDGRTDIESWVVPVNVEQIARMYESAGIRLFARNIRGFLGNTPVNNSMKQTLEKEPEYFWYYNNGVTIVCDSAEQVSRGGVTAIRLFNPQVINGQQTTRTLHQYAGKGSKAAVLVRVISVPRESENDGQRFESLVSQIVAATNWQNAIRPSDLMANDRRQIEIERNLRKLNYQYLRKRQSKGEAKREGGLKHRFLVTKEELAQVTAACDLDPLVVREGKEQLFEERYYPQVFPTSDADYYLSRYWLAKHVSRQAKGYPERAYAKWLVLHFVWNRLAPLLRQKAQKRSFRIESEKTLFDALGKAVESAFKGASAYYRSNRGAGEKQVDPSSFFKRMNHHKEFQNFWESASNKHGTTFAKALDSFNKKLGELVAQ